MKCPHCSKVTKALVNESRRHEGDVYRRRSCGGCGAPFVTVETAPAGLKMPKEVRDSRARGQLDFAARKNRESNNTVSVPKGDAKHLQNIW